MRVRLRERRHAASIVQDQGRAIIDAIVIAVSLLLVFWLVRDLNLFDKLYEATRPYDSSGLDEMVVVVLFSVVGLVLFGVRRLQDQRREIKARQRAEDRARYLAMADALTGLPNRRQFGGRLATALTQLAGNDRSVALMMIDLDRFKPVNDVFGHGIGDQVLIAFAKRASAVAGSEAMLARFGGDEFAHLRECHFDRLKIDRTFVMSMAGSDENTSLVNAILGLSKALGLPVTAEGIENEALIGPLRDGGCSEGQGSQFSQAVPQEEAMGLLEQRSVRRVTA